MISEKHLVVPVEGIQLRLSPRRFGEAVSSGLSGAELSVARSSLTSVPIVLHSGHFNNLTAVSALSAAEVHS